MTRQFYPFHYRLDVSNPMLVPDISGQLLHHDQACAECDGTGFEDYYAPEPAVECCSCAGGARRWGSWYGEDRGLCGSCGAENALIAAMYEDTGDYDGQYVCLVCYVRHHKEVCGCARWAEIEKRLAMFFV